MHNFLSSNVIGTIYISNVQGNLLNSTCFRMGLLCALRSYKTLKAIGICLTASHNEEEDNGIKISDPDGGVLEMGWEKHAQKLANVDASEVVDCLQEICKLEDIKLTLSEESQLEGVPSVFVARDTRKSGVLLSKLAREAAILLKANVIDFGLLTTPQLHHSVRMFNRKQKNWMFESGYFSKYAEAFETLISTGSSPESAPSKNLIIDCAHGIGGLKMDTLSKSIGNSLSIEARNVGDGTLNFECGADFVYRHQTPPKGVSAKDFGTRICSFDGDADRLIYHYYEEDGTWHMLDGDKIAVLYSLFILEQLQSLELIGKSSNIFGIVQTPYANGASTQYMMEQGIEVRGAKTGVKHVHHEAAKFDIGVYFEANGHGTVLFKDEIIAQLEEMKKLHEGNNEKQQAIKRLLSAEQLINQGVGDAISDLLFAEAVLSMRGIGIKQWDELYSNFPCRQIAVKVKDRTAVSTSNDERRVTSPLNLQDAIDGLVSKEENARAFVRPSGTEDVVRVYAEASTQEGADRLAYKVGAAVYDLLDGIGDRPVSPNAEK